MFFRKFFGVAFLALLILGMVNLLGLGGRGRYEQAWNEGYIAGQQAASNSAEGEAGTTTTQTPAPRGFGYGPGMFHPGAGFFGLLIPLFFFVMIFKFFAMHHWRHGHRHHSSRRSKREWSDFDDWPEEPVQKA